MGKAGKKSSIETLVDNTSPPIGKLHAVPIGIQQGQRVSLLKTWMRAIVERFVARRRGRPPRDRRPYIALAEELIKGGVDPSQDRFVGRLRSMLELPKDKIPLELQNKIPELKNKDLWVPGDTVLTEICAPIYERAEAKK